MLKFTIIFKKKNMPNLRRILKLASPLNSLRNTIIILGIISSLLAQAVPFASKFAVDEIQKQIENGTGDYEKMVYIIIGGFVLSVLRIGTSSLTARLGDKYGGELRRFWIYKFYNHIIQLPQSYFDTEMSGKIVNQLNRGIAGMQQFMNTFTNFLMLTFLQTFISILILFYYSWQVGILVVILFPIYISLSMYSSKRWGELEVPKNQLEDLTRSRIQESILNMRLVRGFNRQVDEVDFIEDKQKKVNEIYADQSSTFHKFDFIRNLSLELILLAVYFILFRNTFNGIYTIGEVVLVIQLINTLRLPLITMSFILTQLQTAEAGSKEFFEVMDLEPTEIIDDNDYEQIPVQSIEFSDVRFAYDEEEVLKGVNLKIEKNQQVALIGESGAGKSTVINLIMKFYDPTAGSIILNDRDYSDMTHRELRANTSLVFQDNELFSTTVRENVAYGKPDATDDEVVEALKRANAWDFVSKFDDGIEAEIGERGVKLSGGQKQRIQIARAILKDAEIVILDEATSNLDSRSESLVQKAIENLTKDKIVVIIAHRFSTIQNVDKVFVLDGGVVADSGSPDELAQRDGIYKQLLEYQLDGNKKLLKRFELG